MKLRAYSGPPLATVVTPVDVGHDPQAERLDRRQRGCGYAGPEESQRILLEAHEALARVNQPKGGG